MSFLTITGRPGVLFCIGLGVALVVFFVRVSTCVVKCSQVDIYRFKNRFHLIQLLFDIKIVQPICIPGRHNAHNSESSRDHLVLFTFPAHRQINPYYPIALRVFGPADILGGFLTVYFDPDLVLPDSVR